MSAALGDELIARLPHHPILERHNARVTALALRYCAERGIAVDPAVLTYAGLLHDIMTLVPFRRHPWGVTYVSHSADLARIYLWERALLGPAEIDLVALCIAHHHDLRRHANPVVEAFRNADWNDVTWGLWRRELSSGEVALLRRTHSPSGFFGMLAGIILRFSWRPKNFIRIFWPARPARRDK